MSFERWTPDQIYIYRHPVDMRKQIDGLATIVSTQLERDPADRSLYLFCNKGRDKIKMLIWHLNGYWLLYKRIEKQRFHWPDWFSDDAITLTHVQLDQLLDGYNLNAMRPHKSLSYTHFA